MTRLCKPDNIFWCDGSEEEKKSLTKTAVQLGEVEELDQTKLPGCLYARSKENDVARVEKLTFICTASQRNAGPTNNWMEPKEAYQKLSDIFRGSMAGRTMYVVPYLMGIPGSKFNKIGIELTDSIYQMNSFGPNMMLAKDLLEKGERDTVLQYFELCRKFWKMDWGKLNQWSKEVRMGQTPDFGANLIY